MNEGQWLECTDPFAMLEFTRSKASGRELRLFAVACCRQVSHMLSTEAMDCLELAERVAEGLAGPAERKRGRDMAFQARWLMDDAFRNRRGIAKAAVCDALCRRPYEAASNTVWRTSRLADGNCHLLRDIAFPPFRPPRFDSHWRTPDVLLLAQAAYEERVASDPSRPGWLVLDRERLLVLADALEETGCDEWLILEHLRGPGEHVRGCWALDLVKECRRDS